ncbi:MAG: hypothetical protein ACE5NW_06660 [Acidiferrobacterales bacterium]
MISQQQAVLSSTYADNSPFSDKAGSIATFLWITLAAALVAAALWLAITKLDYTPDSDLGYNLGFVGGVAMLLTLLYPIAKRVRFMHTWMQMRHWFLAHMVLGITGPILILFHSRLTLESINGMLALYSMCLVFLSGVIGRYLHTKIHCGLEDRRDALRKLKQKLGVSVEDVRSKFRFAPKISEYLERFESSALAPPKGLVLNLWYVVTLPFCFEVTYARACWHLRQAIKKRAQKRGWNTKKTRRRAAYGKRMIRAYLEAVRSLARVGAYERLFSLWHIVHIPLLFWLAITGAIHVLAVHMY